MSWPSDSLHSRFRFYPPRRGLLTSGCLMLIGVLTLLALSPAAAALDRRVMALVPAGLISPAAAGWIWWAASGVGVICLAPLAVAPYLLVRDGSRLCRALAVLLGTPWLMVNLPLLLHYTSLQICGRPLPYSYPCARSLSSTVLIWTMTSSALAILNRLWLRRLLLGFSAAWGMLVVYLCMTRGSGIVDVAAGLLLGLCWIGVWGHALPWGKAARDRRGVETLAPARRRNWSLAFAAVLSASLTFLGPWLIDDRHMNASDYFRETSARRDSTAVQFGEGDLELGTAEVDLSPPPGHPLAGFGNRRSNAYQAVDTRCFARALTLRCGTVDVTILTADLLLINEDLARAVLARTGLSPHQIYFTASHTHSGPGGWGDHPLEQFVTGEYDPEYFSTLSQQLSECVIQSRSERERVEVAAVTIPVPEHSHDRIGTQRGVRPQLAALLFRSRRATDRSPSAIMAVYGAHATVVEANPATLSADYPGAFVNRLREQSGAAFVAFAAGAVGDAAPARPAASDCRESARLLGEGLAAKLAPRIGELRYERHPQLAVQRLEVTMPELQVALNARWRVSPLATAWIAEPRTHLHVLRIGPLVLLGMPGDFSGELANRLESEVAGSETALVVTSFNGDYKGYFVSREIFTGMHRYETRVMNFFGPWGGDYLNAIAARMIDRATKPAADPAHARLAAAPVASRRDGGE